jgi:hypothetical protein
MQHHAGAVGHHGRGKNRELCAGYGLPVRTDRTNFRRRGQGDSQGNFLGEFQPKKVISTGQREVHRATVSRDIGDSEWLRGF